MDALQRNVITTKTTLKKLLGCTDDYAYTVLGRLVKQGRLKKIIKGKYTVHDDIYLIATNLYFPSYLSFLSCSYFKGYTEQIINTVQVATTMQIRDIMFENYHLEFHKMGKKMFFGYEKVFYGNFFLFIADDEKLLIDSIYYDNLMGNFDEIVKVFESVEPDIEKLVGYLGSIGNKSLAKKVGFLLEKLKGIDISGRLDYKDKNIILLSSFMEGKKNDKKWQVKHDL
ncbi:MAG: hypothetical protein R6V53_04940 [Candidatus Woesearchaeota archaeon]